MVKSFQDGLGRVAGLTGAGRLMEATAAIQRALGGAAAPDLANRPRVRSPDFLGTVKLRDLVRPKGKAPATVVRVPEGARWLTGSFANQAGSRPYALYVPRAYRAGQRVPLVVMLHGCTQSPEDFAAGTRMNEIAEERNFLVVYPGQVGSANPQKCWNWFRETDQKRNAGEPSLIAGITREVMDAYDVDPRRVFVAGLSAGGAAAAIMGAAYPDLYAAVGVHSGLARGAAHDMPSAFGAMRQGATGSVTGGPETPVPTIVFHGDADTTVSPRNGDAVATQSAGGVRLSTRVERSEVPGGRSYTRTIRADASGRPMVEYWLIHGAAHSWSGGSADGSYTDPQGPDASREMIRFFLRPARA